MSEDYSISYSYQHHLDGTSSHGRAERTHKSDIDKTLYAAADIERVDLRNGSTLLIDKRSDAQMIVAPEVSTVLHSCRTFRTIERHADHLASSIPQLSGQHADIINVLKSIRDGGLLTSADSVCRRLCPREASAATDLPASRVFIITCDRPAAVQRLLESMLQIGSLSRHESLFLVDDSRDPDNAEANRRAVQKFNLSSSRNMFYVGGIEQQHLMSSLISVLPNSEGAIRFLIDREKWTSKKSYGLARTICLLLSVGRRAIVMDDDVVCAAIASPHTCRGLAFGDSEREVDFYSSEQDIRNRSQRLDFDPLSGHASCLGLTMVEAIKALGFDSLQEEDLDGANADYLNLWDANSPILMTQSGTLGDPGTTGTEWVYTLGPSSVARALQAAGGLHSAVSNRHYWMGQPRPRFSKMAVISQVTGLDNSRLLPPYFPVFRGEDYLFGAMTEYLHPNGVTLDYPWCVPHFPISARKGSAGEKAINAKGNFNLPKYITDRTRYHDGISAETRLAGLAQLAQEMSELSDQSLVQLYRVEVAEAQGRLRERIAARLNDGCHRPENWQAYLQQSSANVSEAMQTVAKLEDIPALPAGYDAQTALDDLRNYANEFAFALSQWIYIRRAAKRIIDDMIAKNTFPQ
jgi:hypothetical protein